MFTMTLEQLTTFFGWMSVINLALFSFAVVVMWAFKGPGMRIHSAMFGISEDDLPLEWYRYLGTYNLALVFLNIVPYLALRIIT